MKIELFLKKIILSVVKKSGFCYYKKKE